MGRRATGALSGLLGIALVALTLPEASLARTDPSFAPSPDLTSEHATSDVAPVRIIHRATLEPLPRFATRPFAISWVTIQNLAWADLPLNGKTLLGLKFGAGTDSDGIAYKVIDGRRVYSPGNLAESGIRYVDGYVRTGNPAYLDWVVASTRESA